MTQNINLYEAPKPQARSLFSRQGALLVGASALIGMSAMYWLTVQETQAQQAELKRLQSEAQRIERMIAQVPSASADQADKLTSEEREVAALEAIAARLSTGSLGQAGNFTEHLRAFGRASTDGVWLTGIHINNSNGSLTIEGRALDASRLPALIDALRKEPLFAGTPFGSIEMKAVESGDSRRGPITQAVRFRIRTSDGVPINDKRSAPTTAPASAASNSASNATSNSSNADTLASAATTGAKP